MPPSLNLFEGPSLDSDKAKAFNYFCNLHCFCLHLKGSFVPFMGKVDFSEVLSLQGGFRVILFYFSWL